MARIRSHPDEALAAERKHKKRRIERGATFVIVCSCNVISDQQVRSIAAERVVRATSEVYRCLGCSAECGRCARTIRRIMEEALVGVTVSPAACACGSQRRLSESAE